MINHWGSKTIIPIIFSLVILVMVNSPVARAEKLLSLDKPVLASTQEGWNPAENAVDGLAITRWAASSGSYPNWLRVDLGSVCEISRVNINWFDPENRSYKYKIETSNDDVNYEVVVDQTERVEIGNSSDPVDVSARYLRVTVTGGQGSPSFSELQVFGVEGEGAVVETSDIGWVGTWAASQQLVEPHNMPPSPGLTNQTLRQVVRVSIGGEQVRLKFSNEYGDSPLVINSVHFAQSKGLHTIDPKTGVMMTFNGSESVTIEPGKTVVSDPFPYKLQPLTEMAVTINFSNVPAKLTGHPGSRTESFISADSAVDVVSMPSAVRAEKWYVLSNIDIKTEAKASAVVTLGDSITDGRGSTTNQNNRWPDILAERLQKEEATTNVAVLNHGIGGNAAVFGGLGPTAFSRFNRDVLEASGVRYVIILIGVNDIGGSNSLALADDLISVYKAFIEKARAKDILVYGGTILPFKGSGYYTPTREQIRQKVNDWVRTSGQFDAVLDFDLALRDPSDPEKLLNQYDSGDYLHPSAEGYRRMGESINLNHFTK